ncbi:unnamed protein product, partial [marine sediment metagenome]
THKEVYKLREENEALKIEAKLGNIPYKEAIAIKQENRDLKNNILDKLDRGLPEVFVKADEDIPDDKVEAYEQGQEDYQMACLRSVEALIKEIRECL